MANGSPGQPSEPPSWENLPQFWERQPRFPRLKHGAILCGFPSGPSRSDGVKPTVNLQRRMIAGAK